MIATIRGNSPMRIALTGGIGCGKSAVLKIFGGTRGFDIFSADDANKALLERQETVDFVAKNFGKSCVPAGKIDKSELAKIIFSVPAARAKLENYLHPLIAQAEEIAAQNAQKNGKILVSEIPLLFEKNLQKNYDKTICVACSDEIRLARLEKRGLTRAASRERILAQMSLDEKMHLADFVIFNDGVPAALAAQIEQFSKQIFQKI